MEIKWHAFLRLLRTQYAFPFQACIFEIDQKREISIP
jgi:hypothetical protein